MKPENILVNAAGAAKLVDFSCALKGWRTWLPWVRKAAGSASYMAPEQLLGRALGPTADIYALGAVLYEMYAGVPPFVGESEEELLNRKRAILFSSAYWRGCENEPDFAKNMIEPSRTVARSATIFSREDQRRGVAGKAHMVSEAEQMEMAFVFTVLSGSLSVVVLEHAAEESFALDRAGG